MKIKTDVCIIGGGSGGLSIAAGAVQMGAKVVLIERDKMGGDCLNAGCVPSKALIAAGEAAFSAAHADRFGLKAHTPEVDFKLLHQHIHGVIAAIAPNDSETRFEALGVKVIKAEAHFLDKKTVKAGRDTITARRFVIATGSRAAIPPIEGLDHVPFLTNETIFDLTEKPDHLIIIGGGPIGCEMAQAYRRLGCRVTVLELFSIMPKDDPELVNIVREQCQSEGVELFENIQIERIEQHSAKLNVLIQHKKEKQIISGTHLLVAAGRKPNVENLKLTAANITFDQRGIEVNAKLQSVSNRRVFVAGDTAGGFQFTHAASYHAGIIIRNILFGLPAKVDYSAMPWCTYVQPELSHVGLQASQAKEKNIIHRVLRFAFKDNDRAQAERETVGLIKVIVDRKGRILGCSIVGKNAGELILPWCLAVQNKMKIAAMASVIAPYPTLSEISKRVASSYFTDTLFSNKVKLVVRLIQRFF